MLAAGSSEHELRKRMQAVINNTRKMNGYFFMVVVVKDDYRLKVV